jgi:hypothetical protein
MAARSAVVLRGVESLCTVQQHLASGGELGRHVGEMVAYRLVFPDRFAEAFPLLRV